MCICPRSCLLSLLLPFLRSLCVCVCTFNRDFILDIYVCWLYCFYLGDLGSAEEPRWDVLAACTIEDSMDEESMAYFVTLLKAPQHCYCPEPSDGNSIEYR